MDHSAVVRPIRRDCFSTTEWCVFKDTDINTYTDAVIGYIGKCIDDVEVQVRTPESHQQRKETVQGQSSNTRSMWAGLKTLTDYKKKISSAEVMSASLPDELNTFYACFESTSPAVEVQKAQEDHCPPVISRADVCRTLKRINTRKAPGPDGIPRPSSQGVCRSAGRRLCRHFQHVTAPVCSPHMLQWRPSIVPGPKKTKILSLNDYRPVALTSTIMKCFERLVKSFITSSIPDSLDPLQFAYRPNWSTEDAIALTLHTALSHLDQRDTYVRMLFIDYSSAFNTIVPSKLVTKLRDLGLNSALCDWILNFLTRQTPGCADGQHHILHPDSEHRRPPGLCAQPSAVLPVHA
ncbi:hypothetical protein L3Q82_018983 [Scortum barcoo]|uniref:Uncharacterized protein n=1 Tax=Scortum barcoo TaxID=214431 RepID=A0ACB8VG87_9TELE|nr:hypothetical protein L3Q82_018983 [Scortum barcoo]